MQKLLLKQFLMDVIKGDKETKPKKPQKPKKPKKPKVKKQKGLLTKKELNKMLEKHPYLL